ncbi:hypothetical protein BD410DRAFT_836417 [Rickenella mellea]|uniref:F-box domain-containing protein n=1 Tax=Rickenella mellea TaxID=50990 RepID=A0A4Y7QFU1_9AGAM|nr:hypothetical protein BD410DRAFT_836417 [Rickenella mellea]
MTPSLPTELLKKIFGYATYAGVDVDLAVTHREIEPFTFAKFEKDSLDTMATKISLTRVSRRFRRIALEFLFKFVCIYTSKQATKLVNMMKRPSSNAGLGPREWIKFLFVRCSIERRVTEILQLCRGLRGISWNPTTFQRSLKNWEAVQDEMIRNIPTNIRILHWNGRVLFSTFASFLQRASALRILYVSGVTVDTTLPQPVQSALYASLTNLHVEHPPRLGWLDNVTWEMPSLIELSLFVHYHHYRDGSFPSFVRNVSKTLRVLRLGPHVELVPQLMSHILNTCVNLEEIYYYTIHEHHSFLWAFHTKHTTMKRIGLSIFMERHTMDRASATLRQYLGPISKARFPSLDTVVVCDASRTPLIPTGSHLRMKRVSEDFYSAEISLVHNVQ